jgi:hypothetical protein
MNYDFNNLESLLRSGATADEIAVAFTKNLNDAIDVTKRNSQLYDNLANSWNEVLKDWIHNNKMPDGIEVNDLILTGDHAKEVVSQLMEFISTLAPLYKALTDMAEQVAAKEKSKPEPVLKNTDAKNEFDDFDEAMRNFLKSIGV